MFYVYKVDLWTTKGLPISAKWQPLVGENACNALIEEYVFTSSHTVTNFIGRQKVHAFKLMKKEKAYQQIFRELCQ